MGIYEDSTAWIFYIMLQRTWISRVLPLMLTYTPSCMLQIHPSDIEYDHKVILAFDEPPN
jgi:hypothetical protein